MKATKARHAKIDALNASRTGDRQTVQGVVTAEKRAERTQQPDHLLTYRGRLPNCNRDAKWWGRYNLKKVCLRQWGELPRPMRATRKARLEICRVLGPRERKTDFTNLTYRCKGLEDALVSGGYLVDDSPTWLEWPPLYWTDDQRRRQGPKVEVKIWYK